MIDDVCAVVLAAGLGTRLRPLTDELPKALVPVGNVALLDRALDRLAAIGLTGPDRVAVNAHHHAELIVRHVGDRAHLSVELPEPLGSAGALGQLQPWIAGRAVLVVNADAYVTAPRGDLRSLLDGWDGDAVRLHGIAGDDGHPPFDGLKFAGASLLPAADAAALRPELLATLPAELVLTTWRPAQRAGRLQAIPLSGDYIDCGAPGSYLAANLRAAGQDSLIAIDAKVTGTVHNSVVGAAAEVAGSIRRCVLWPGALVAAGESLAGVIRTTSGVTIDATRA